MSELGGPNLPGVGFSFGIERIASVLQDDELLPEDINEGVKFYVMPLGKDAQIAGTLAANAIRMTGSSVDICFDDVKIGAMFKRAEKKHARFAVIIGDEELKTNTVIIKDLEAKQQITVPIEELSQEAAKIAFHGHTDPECCCGEEGGECCCGHEHHNDDGHCCCEEDEHHHEDGCCCGKHHKENE